MKTLLFITLSFFIPSLSWASCKIPNLPSSFILNEHIVSLSTKLSVESGNSDFGTVTEKIVSVSKSFRYKDPQGQLISYASQKILSWGVQIDIFDCENKKLGSIKEEVLRSLVKINTVYSIYDAQDRIIAKSNKVDWLATSFTLKDNQGHTVATLNRPMFNLLGDNWNVRLHNHDSVDPRIFIMIGAYKTSADNDRTSEENDRASEE